MTRRATRVFAITAGLGLALICAPNNALANEVVWSGNVENAHEPVLAETVGSILEQSQTVGKDADVSGPMDHEISGNMLDDANSIISNSAGDIPAKEQPLIDSEQPDLKDNSEVNVIARNTKETVYTGNECSFTDSRQDDLSNSDPSQNDADETGIFNPESTTSSEESDTSQAFAPHAKGWDGDNYYDGTNTPYTGWVVDDHAGGLDRYWIELGKLWRNGLKRASDGFWFYSLSTGHVLRNAAYRVGDVVYMADNDGRLAGGDNGGWVVSSAYGQGLQRYYIESSEHGSVIGHSQDGWDHYTTEDGYVLRGRKSVGNKTYLANNEGRLESTGWHVTSAYGQGLQRYYIDAEAHAAVTGFSADGWTHYTTEAGYVLRGAHSGGDGMCLADNDGRLAHSQWIVTSAFGQGLQRYWASENGSMAKSRLILASEGAGYNAYATAAGYVLRGALRDGDKIYLADNDGRLADSNGSGWVVTSAYGQGLQRYWIEKGGYAQVGYSTAGWTHFTTDAGYVLRGTAFTREGKRYADNDGRLASSQWLVTSSFGDGLQRYWADSHGVIATSRLISANEGAGYYAFATPSGAVVRGNWSDPSTGFVYLGDNDGRLAQTGWVVSSEYGQGLQRYWIDEEAHACIPGFSSAGYAHYTTKAGYVLRGALNLEDYVALADNDGLAPSSTGWLVTDSYSQGLRRYWLIDVSGSNSYSAAKVGFITSGNTLSYGTDAGYVVINQDLWLGDEYYSASNDGVLTVLHNAYSNYVKSYVGWLLAIAADECHGYDQEYRWGEHGDYDCSSLVITALQQAGLDAAWAYYTGNMRSALCSRRFEWMTDFSQLQRGDILLCESSHTAVYLGNNQLVHASANEFRGAVGGAPGDQTGKEICVRSYFWYPWDGFLRLEA